MPSPKKPAHYCPNCKCTRYKPCYCLRKGRNNKAKPKKSVEEIVSVL